MIRLGYELGTGTAVDIPADRHLAIAGQTQRSGKTTTLEALVSRSGMRAIAFVTKRAEGSFRSARSVPPYFRDFADWELVTAILEAAVGERLKFERSWIIEACNHAENLAGVAANIRRRLHGEKDAEGKWALKPATSRNRSVLTTLDAYMQKVLPQIERLPFTPKLQMSAGLNVMDLSEYSTELQGLVIRSVLEWVYEHERHTIVVIPEAWEFLPQTRRSPVLLACEELIRKGAAAGNFLWLDSQDLAAVHKNVLRSVGVWIVGVQREVNEVRRTLDTLPIRPAPRADEIMQLGRGEFFVAWERAVRKVYVQPFWIGDVHARAIARGEEQVESAEKIWRELRGRPPDVAEAETPRCPACGQLIPGV